MTRTVRLTDDARNQVDGYRLSPGGYMHVLQHQTPLADLACLQRIVEQYTNKRQRPITAVEVGSWVGESAMAIRESMSYGGTLWCVDNFGGGPEDDPLNFVVQQVGDSKVESVFRENTQRHLGDTIFLLKMSSLEAAQSNWAAPVDLIFLDASHDYESVKEDLDAWWPLLAEGGLLCGHDYGQESYFPGVQQAVDEFANQHHLTVAIPRYSSIWATQKITHEAFDDPN